jgi:hypothetical protein
VFCFTCFRGGLLTLLLVVVAGELFSGKITPESHPGHASHENFQGLASFVQNGPHLLDGASPCVAWWWQRCSRVFCAECRMDVPRDPATLSVEELEMLVHMHKDRAEALEAFHKLQLDQETKRAMERDREIETIGSKRHALAQQSSSLTAKMADIAAAHTDQLRALTSINNAHHETEVASKHVEEKVHELKERAAAAGAGSSQQELEASTTGASQHELKASFRGLRASHSH